MSHLRADASLHLPGATSRASRVTGIGIQCSVSRLLASVAHALQQCATGERRDERTVHRESFKGFGEIAWRQFGRQEKGGAN